MAIRIPIGGEFFDKIIKNGSYYIDKTELIYELLTQDDVSVALFTRPRRFGKTLTMTMLQSFLDITQDSRELFKGLSVSKHEQFCDDWMNRYPVVFLTLKDVEGLSYDSAYSSLESLIARSFGDYFRLENDERITPEDREAFHNLIYRCASSDEIKNSLRTISNVLKAVYEKPVVLLIDEYDVPLAKARENGYYPQMLDLMRRFLSSGLKTNNNLAKAILTGCLRISKESIFTGVNNFASFSVLDKSFSNYFGFTYDEVSALLHAAERDDHLQIMKEWYDGYIFGNTPVYCPWDAVQYVANIIKFPNDKPKNYWKNSSGNGIIREFVEDDNFNVNDKFETLLNGGTITQKISDELTYDKLKFSEDNLWSVLVMTGYLTKADPEEDGDTVSLRIPNAEIATIFEETVVSWFSETLDTERLNSLMNALWNGDEAAASEIFSDMLFDTISYMDYHEDYYHAFLAGVFVGRGYGVESNKEKGLGRPDIFLTDRKNRRAMLIEAKKSRSEERMEQDCREALAQIDEQQYARRLKGYRQVMRYGVAFFEKQALVKKSEE